jgi:hypothetical protein
MESSNKKKQEFVNKSYEVDKNDFYYLSKQRNGKRISQIREYKLKLKKIFFNKEQKTWFSPIEIENIRNEIRVFISLLNGFETYIRENIEFCKKDIKEKNLDDLMLLVELLEKSEIINEVYFVK